MRSGGNGRRRWGAGPCYASAVARPRTAAKDEDDLALLYEALDSLRAATEPFGPAHEARWRVVERWIRVRHHHDHLGDRDDVIQEAVLAIGRNVSRMDATTPAAAAKWVSTIVHRKRVDALRGSVRRGGPAGGSGEAEVDDLEAPEPAVPPEVLEERHARIEEVVLRHVERTVEDPLLRMGRRGQVRACIYRLVRDLEIPEVEARLRLADPISRELLYKWIERGRPTVAAAMRAWAEASAEDDEVQSLAAVVIELVEARRADAGKPRPDRRHGDGQP